jgi:hypothetical protein
MSRADNGPDQLAARQRFERGLYGLIARYGAPRDGVLEGAVAACVEQMREALIQSTGGSLSGLDVVRIRAGKFAAAHLPAVVFRYPKQLAALRAEILPLASAWLDPPPRS